MLDTYIRVLYVLTHFILKTVLGGGHCYFSHQMLEGSDRSMSQLAEGHINKQMAELRCEAGPHAPSVQTSDSLHDPL